MKRSAIGGALAIVATSLIIVTGPGDAGNADKWFVCKYVTTPGEGEQLQTGQNPISVDASAIPLDPVVAGAEFADQQGRSIVLVADTGQPEPDAGDCPPPQGGTTTTVGSTTTPPTTTSSTTTTEPTSSSTTTTAATSTTPSTTSSSVAPTTTLTPTTSPILNVEILEPICDGDVPYLSYSVAFPGATDVDRITFVNPDGEDFTYTGLPLAGRVLWPGAVVDAEGNPVDWPGWTEVSPDVWVEGDEWDWVRPSVTVEFEVNPVEQFEVGYPPATPQCSANPPTPPGASTTTVPGGANPPSPPAPPGSPTQPLPPTR